MSRQRDLILLAGCLLVATVLRLGALGREGLWLDELFTVHTATRPTWAALFAQLAEDVHPPLWSGLLHLLPPAGDAGWRLPSAVAGVAGVGLAAALTRALAGPGPHGDRAVLLAAGLVSTAPAAVLLDREAGANALLSALTLLLARALLRPADARTRWVIAGVVAVLVNLHPFGGFAVVTAVAFRLLEPAAQGEPRLREVLVGAGVGALALLPWAGVLATQVGRLVATPWYAPPPGDSVGWILRELADGQPGYLIAPALGITLGLRNEGAAERRSLVLLVAAIFGLVLLPQAVSYAAAPILRARSAAPVLPLLLIAGSLGLARAGRLGTLLGATAIAAQLLGSWHATRVETRMEQWREAAARLRERAAGDDLVIANRPELWRHYLGPGLNLQDVEAPGVDAAPGAWVLLAHELEPPALLAALAPEVIDEEPFFGARLQRRGPLSRPLALSVADTARGRAVGGRAELWSAATATTPPIVAWGDCAVVLRAHEDAAGTEAARLRVRLRDGETALLDEAFTVAPGELRTTEVPALRARADLRVDVSFENDALVDGHDRNAYVDELRLRCR